MMDSYIINIRKLIDAYLPTADKVDYAIRTTKVDNLAKGIKVSGGKPPKDIWERAYDYASYQIELYRHELTLMSRIAASLSTKIADHDSSVSPFDDEKEAVQKQRDDGLINRDQFIESMKDINTRRAKTMEKGATLHQRLVRDLAKIRVLSRAMPNRAAIQFPQAQEKSIWNTVQGEAKNKLWSPVNNADDEVCTYFADQVHRDATEPSAREAILARAKRKDTLAKATEGQRDRETKLARELRIERRDRFKA